MAETELDRTKRLALTIKESIETSTHDDRENLLNNLYLKWVVKSDQNSTVFDYLKLALSNFGLSTENLQIGLFDRALKVVTFELTYLHLFILKMDSELSAEKKEEYSEKFTKLFRAIIDAGNAISSSLYLMSSMTLEEIGKEKTTKAEMFRYSDMDYDTLGPCQSLILYILEQLQRKEHRRYVVEDMGMCYQKIYNTKGQDTHAWKSSMTVKNFVLDNTRKELNANMWKNLTAAKENLKFVTQHLTDCLAPEFEDLEKDRHIFSFNNGIYITKVKCEDDNDERVWLDQWIPFEGSGAKKIGASVVASKYFNLEFEDCCVKNGYENWFDIIKKCPHFKSVMDYQQWPEEVQKWLCILMGRMLYDVGELDDWQVYVFLLGMAGSGKCMGFGTKIMTYTGEFKEIQDIKIGDRLMGDDSTFRTVLSVNKGYGKMYKIKQDSGDDYVVNGEHILSLHSSISLSIIDMSVNDYLKFDQEQKNGLNGYKVPIYFSEKETPVDPYLIGLWIGGGDMFETNNEHIPDIYKYNSRENQLKILAGLIDSDASIDSDNYDITRKNYRLSKDIEYIARCLGLSSEIVEYEITETDILYNQTISGNHVVCIPCKTIKNSRIVKNNLLSKINIEELDENDFYGFQIDGNQRFLLGDHTVTHNSTIIENILKQFYELADVGIIGNNIEKKFGLSGLIGKKIVIGPEIKGNWAIDQAELQSMISGESVQVNTKFKQASSLKFSSHIAIAGNIAPDFQDNAGSMSRRTVVFPFEYKVKKGDGKLGQKIQKEMAFIIQVCNKGYLDAIHKYHSTGIWEIMPELFKITQESMAEHTNALTHFIKSDLVVLGKDQFCREKIFVAAFNEHCKESHFVSSKWTNQFFSGPFSDAGITLSKNCRKRYPNRPGEPSYCGTFIVGIDIKEGTFGDGDVGLDEETSQFE